MLSFKDIRDFLFAGYAHDMFDDEEFCLLYDFYRSKNPDYPYSSYASFDLEEMDPAECYTEFRVEKWHIPLLADRLQIPPTFQCPQRSVCDGIEGLCMLLKRLAYPCRYSDMVHRFARPVPVLSMITNTVLEYIYDRHSHRLAQWNNQVMNPNHLQQYADAISAKGSPLDNCFGFVDGTVRPISHPGQHQRAVYNGHKRVHALKFQSLALPNGIIGNLYGPIGMLIIVWQYLYMVLCSVKNSSIKNQKGLKNKKKHKRNLV